MINSLRPPLGKTLAAALAATVFLGAGFATSGQVGAQTPQAAYALTTDLLDATATFGPVQLLGTPAPAAPSAGGVCHNGVWLNNAGGQEILTPTITSLTPTDFELDVEFNLAALPTNPVFGGPVIVGGNLQRWIGIEVDSGGTLVLLYNNAMRVASTTVVTPGTWYSVNLRYENGVAQLNLNGAMILQVTTGPLSDGGDWDFMTANYSVGTGLNGCIRGLVISNDTTLIGGDYQVNTPAASLVVGGIPDAGSFAPMTTTTPVGATILADLTSTNVGLGWDIALTTSASVPGTAGGIATGGGQFVNVDLGDPSFTTIFNLTFGAPFVNQLGLPVSAPAPILFSGQMIVLDPGSTDGFALSHVNEMEFVACANPENFDAATPGAPGTLPPCWSDGGGIREWRVNNGGTPSGNTGPTGDNTTGSGNYMYCETSAPAALGDTYILNAPPSQIIGGGCQFAYHMFGATVGTLELQELVGGVWTTVWTLTGDQGNAWTTTPLILLNTNPTTVRLVYTRGASFTGDVAIDDFQLL